MKSGNLLTLWSEALGPEQIPPTPPVLLLKAKGGETTYFAAERIPLTENRTFVVIATTPAEPDELLRGPDLKFLPDWTENLRHRMLVKSACDGNPAVQSVNTLLCKSSILYFANTFAWTLDPRRTDIRKIPFVTYPFQDDLFTWIVWMIQSSSSGIVEKSRDMGVSWIAAIAAVWLAIFFENVEAMFMSMNEPEVDNRTESSLLGKVRYVLRNLPDWMRAGWIEEGKGDRLMTIQFNETESLVSGILSRGAAGRSKRATVVFSDEFAFVEDSEMVLKPLSEVANTKLYLSTPNGAGNAFHRMAHEQFTPKKTLHYRLHPLKSPEWQEWKRGQADMTEETWSQEQEIQYETSVIGRVFPQFVSVESPDAKWIHAQDSELTKYDPAYDVYSFTDLGISDPCSTVWCQIKPAPPDFQVFTKLTLVFFEENEARNMTAYDLRFIINRKKYRYRHHIVDERTATQRDSSDSTWRKNLADDEVSFVYSRFFHEMIDVGDPVITVGLRNQVDPTIETFRKYLNMPGAIAVSRANCPRFILAMQNWKFPLDKNTNLPVSQSKPDHSQWSHYCKAALYGVDLLFGKGQAIMPDEQDDWNFPARRVSSR